MRVPLQYLLFYYSRYKHQTNRNFLSFPSIWNHIFLVNNLKHHPIPLNTLLLCKWFKKKDCDRYFIVVMHALDHTPLTLVCRLRLQHYWRYNFLIIWRHPNADREIQTDFSLTFPWLFPSSVSRFNGISGPLKGSLNACLDWMIREAWLDKLICFVGPFESIGEDCITAEWSFLREKSDI